MHTCLISLENVALCIHAHVKVPCVRVRVCWCATPLITGCLLYWSAPCFCCRYLSGGFPGESPPVATASAQSREGLAAVKQALRALGFNKQVLIGSVYTFCWACFIKASWEQGLFKVMILQTATHWWLSLMRFNPRFFLHIWHKLWGFLKIIVILAVHRAIQMLFWASRQCRKTNGLNFMTKIVTSQ